MNPWQCGQREEGNYLELIMSLRRFKTKCTKNKGLGPTKERRGFEKNENIKFSTSLDASLARFEMHFGLR